MATVTQTYYADDTDPAIEARYRVRIVVNGIEWELDLSDDHHDEFNADMRKWTKHARKVGGQRIEPKPLKGRKYSVEDEEERRQIRAWAKANGKDVSEYGGRLADDYIQQYCQPNRPDKRNAATPELEIAAVAPNDASVEARPEPEPLESEERSIVGKMTQEGWYYESFGDAVTVAERNGRHAIPKDGGGLVVLKEGVPYLQSLSEAAEAEKAARGTGMPEKAAAAKTNKNATAAVMRKLFSEASMWRTAADSMCVDTKDVFVQRAKGWLGDETNLRHKTLETADWEEVYEHALSTRQDEVEASAEVGPRTEPAGAVEVRESVDDVPVKPGAGRRGKAAGTARATTKKSRPRAAAKSGAGVAVSKDGDAGEPTSTPRRRRAAVTTGT